MIEKFANLNEIEFNKLKAAIAQITILIAGADGKIDKEEAEWAKKVTEIRSYKMHKDLKSYYQEVGKTYVGDMNAMLLELPTDYVEREKILISNLSDLNIILAKLDGPIGARLYQSFKSFANHVAKASGGFMGFFSVDSRESELIQLSMIKPIDALLTDEEE
jgi:hypothetical protein